MLGLKKLMGVLLIAASPFLYAEEYKQIIKDEGIVYQVYVGPKGYLHAGVGHLLPSNGQYKVGQKVSLRQVSEWFWADYAEAEKVAEEFAPRAPKEVRDIIVNMAFNLGRGRLLTFERMRKAVQEEDWMSAAIEMQESYWYYDVGHRSKRLVNRMFNYGFAERNQTE